MSRVIATVLLTFLWMSALDQIAHAATCVGADPCGACKNCRYCARCAKGGKTCGTCKR